MAQPPSVPGGSLSQSCCTQRRTAGDRPGAVGVIVIVPASSSTKPAGPRRRQRSTAETTAAGDSLPAPDGTLFLVLGDQLDHDSPVLRQLDRDSDAVWMAEVADETQTDGWPAHQLRLAFFFSAMRHFRAHLVEQGVTVHYHGLGSDGRRDRGRRFDDVLGADLKRLKPARVAVVEPGDHRVEQMLVRVVADHGLKLELLEDSHFLLSKKGFEQWAGGRREFLLETFYRHMRKKTGILMAGGKPEGGRWNFDQDNRESFGRRGPDLPPSPPYQPHDALTRDVVAMVAARFADHPGKAAALTLPVDRAGALAWLRDFVDHRLAGFGRWQDAMWQGESFLHHSRLSALMNVKLLHPREVIDAALAARVERNLPLNSVEGFVRQILGWREYVRGLYWLRMPDYERLNHLGADRDLPSFYWDGRTDMACVRDAMATVLEHGYAHHIQRLMVLGLFAQLYGVDPLRFHHWHMAMYADAIDWVSMPNTIGMSQYGDGGIVGTKPYCASGAYIRRMGNHCAGCRFRPDKSEGEQACPFTVLYWHFLDRNEHLLGDNRRLLFQLRNLRRKSAAERREIRRRGDELIAAMDWDG